MYDIPDFNVIRDQPPVDGFGGVRHEYTSFERRLREEPGQRTAVVQVETKYETNINL